MAACVPPQTRAANQYWPDAQTFDPDGELGDIAAEPSVGVAAWLRVCTVKHNYSFGSVRFSRVELNSESCGSPVDKVACEQLNRLRITSITVQLQRLLLRHHATSVRRCPRSQSIGLLTAANLVSPGGMTLTYPSDFKPEPTSTIWRQKYCKSDQLTL